MCVTPPLSQASEVQGRTITKGTYIFDLKGLTMSPSTAATETFKASLFIDANFFPESLEKGFIINTPWIFQGIWAFVSPWLDPVTMAKARTFDTQHTRTHSPTSNTHPIHNTHIKHTFTLAHD